MSIYMIFYILIFTPFIFYSLINIFEKNKNSNNYAFFFISSLILAYTIPIFFFNFQNYIISTLMSLILFSFITILSFKFYQKNNYSLLYTVPAIYFTYYTFCFCLAINLNH